MKSVLMKARASLEQKGVFPHGALPEPIADSWYRCLEYGLDPNAKPVDAVISYGELRQAREREEKLIAVVRPELELLSKQIAGTNFMAAFADCNGVVLDAIMDAEFRGAECSRSIRRGSVWREELRGTNALGLALFTGQSSMVTGHEHFFSNQTGVSCISAPIFDGTGQIVGLLDTSSEIAARQIHTKALLDLAVTNIENRLFVEEHRGDHIIQFHPRKEYLATQSVGMMSLNDDGFITGANRRAGEILSGIDLETSRAFADVFQGSFGRALSSMSKSAAIQLTDWLNASYFARIRMTRPYSLGARPSVKLVARPAYELGEVRGAPVYRDEHVRNSLRTAQRSAALGLPFCVVGAPGAGRTTFAQMVHEGIHKDRPLIALDCQIAGTAGADEPLTARSLLGESVDRLETEAGGTLVLERLSRVRGQAATGLAQLVNQLLEPAAGPRWVIMATDDAEGSAGNTGWCETVRSTFSRITQMKVHLPGLAERTDFQQIAMALLATISPSHQLSNSAVAGLETMERSRNLVDLELQLRLLAVRCPVGIIRRQQVERHLGKVPDRAETCRRCHGNSAREAKCREINRVFRQCDANVALTARRLGVSRNTVYSHLVE